jgi:hypothetical protein
VPRFSLQSLLAFVAAVALVCALVRFYGWLEAALAFDSFVIALLLLRVLNRWKVTAIQIQRLTWVEWIVLLLIAAVLHALALPPFE